MILGRFAENPASGVFVGHIRTLFFKSDKVVFEPIEGANDKSPSHRVYSADEVELGAAWRKTAKETGVIYYDVTLDDPTFAGPIYARLVGPKSARKDQLGYMLIWERGSKKKIAA